MNKLPNKISQHSYKTKPIFTIFNHNTFLVSMNKQTHVLQYPEEFQNPPN